MLLLLQPLYLMRKENILQQVDSLDLGVNPLAISAALPQAQEIEEGAYSV